MTDRELEALLVDLESDRVERKENAKDGDQIRRTVCAFANDMPEHNQPGVLCVGAKDDGGPSGLKVTDQLLLDLAKMRDDGNILPLPSMTVEKRRLQGAEMAVVIVEPSDSPPVRYKGITWIRVGPRLAIASVQEERRLSERRLHRNLPFDVRPQPAASLEDLNQTAFRNDYLPYAVDPHILLENQRSTEEQLCSLHFAVPGTPPVPTLTGLLAIGNDPRQALPCHYIQFVRFAGDNLASPVADQHELTGPLRSMLLAADTLIRINVSNAADIAGGAVERRMPDYPEAAIRQIVYNAVMHRNYEGTNAPVKVYWFSDRVEVHSPGGPFGDVNISNFGKPGYTDYRNPNLASVMKTLGFVQRFGAGITIARQQLQANGNPELEFVVQADHVAAILRKRP